MKNTLSILIGLSLVFSFSCTCKDTNKQKAGGNYVKPYAINPKYWQYKGKPVLLLGGSKTDHLFLAENLREHLDEMVGIGANYVRNTMSQREGLDLKPYKRLFDVKFDLNQWNDVYWQKFADFLKWTYERDIIVQIEVWDRFDYSQKIWQHSPWRPENNINYSNEESGFADTYPEYAWRDLQPFFHTVPGMPKYRLNLDMIRKYQEKFVDKMLSYSLNYSHVLYCMNNETSTPAEWGKYWINYINEKANAIDVNVFCTDMFDGFFKPQSCSRCLKAIKETDIYTFLDVSQNNSRNFNESHWETLQWIIQKRDKFCLRPINNTKIYGGGNSSWGSGSNDDGIERFCRNIIGGCAASRHHGPPSGNGLNDKAKASIKSVRQVERYVKFWEVKPRMDLLSDREEDEVYVSAKEGEKYILYFTDGGDVKLDLNRYKQTYEIKWININTGKLGPESTLKGGNIVSIATPYQGSWFAILISQ